MNGSSNYAAKQVAECAYKWSQLVITVSWVVHFQAQQYTHSHTHNIWSSPNVPGLCFCCNYQISCLQHNYPLPCLFTATETLKLKLRQTAGNNNGKVLLLYTRPNFPFILFPFSFYLSFYSLPEWRQLYRKMKTTCLAVRHNSSWKSCSCNSSSPLFLVMLLNDSTNNSENEQVQLPTAAKCTITALMTCGRQQRLRLLCLLQPLRESNLNDLSRLQIRLVQLVS